MIGANALIAETGSVMLVTNEGNGDLVSTLPKLLIVIAGWEKIVPKFEDATAQIRLLARSGTGQEITTYTSFITGPEEGCELHIVLVDNGRSAMWSDPDAREALRCIRCAACADVCAPVCPVGIPLPRLILDARARQAEAHGLPWYKRAAFGVLAHPRLFDAAGR